MKKILLLILALAAASVSRAQTKAVTQGAGDHAITDDLIFGSGKTLTLNGALSGTPTGGTLDLSALTLTLPAASLGNYSLTSAINGWFADPSTNGSFAAGAWRSDLGLVIGTNVQAYDADLTAWAGVNPSSYSNTADIAAAYQPLDADLTDLADGSLTGSKVGSGINADNITTGTVADARIASTIARDSTTPYGQVNTKTASFTVTTADKGKHFICELTSSNIAVTLPSASTAGAGFKASFEVGDTIEEDSGTYRVTVNGTTLSWGGESVVVLSDGASWHSVNHHLGLDRLGNTGVTIGVGSNNTKGRLQINEDGFLIIYNSDGIEIFNSESLLWSDGQSPNNPILSLSDKRLYSKLNSGESWRVAPVIGSGDTGLIFSLGSGSATTPNQNTYFGRVTTTTNTTTTIYSLPIGSSHTVGFEARVVARRTGGSGGTAEDGAFYKVAFAAKGNAGNNASLIGSATVTTIGESQAGWDVTVTASGGNILIQATGATNNNISWNLVGESVYTIY